MELISKTYTYILAIVLCFFGIIYMNIVDEADEKEFNLILEKNQKEIFQGYLKDIKTYRFEYQLIFEDPTTQKRDTFWVEDVLKTEFENFLPEKKNWYKIEYLREPEAILDFKKIDEQETKSSIENLSENDVSLIETVLKNERVADIIFSIILLLIIAFCSLRIWWIKRKLRKQQHA